MLRKLQIFLIAIAGAALIITCFLAFPNSVLTSGILTGAGQKTVKTAEADTAVTGQALTILIKQTKPLKDILSEKRIDISKPEIEIIINKSDQVLGLFSQGEFLKAYHVELGEGGIEDKIIEGDRKTPEGNFYITEKYMLSPADKYLGSRWMRLSYPNIEDGIRGLQQGLIDKQVYEDIVNAINNNETPPQDTVLGSAVGIHGGSRAELGSNWTWGCVGLTDDDVEDFYDYVSIGTKVTIRK